jgi:adenylate kinase family enzyme
MTSHLGSLDGKVALVTGASRGIGRAAAVALAKIGAVVAVNYRTCVQEAEAVSREIQDMGGRAISVPADVSIAVAILLLGPTGSGKTPLGQVLEERGLWGHGCLHFDFGANLREIVAREEPDAFVGADDIVLLRRMVREGLLLEDEHFPLATRILGRFLARHSPCPSMWIVLNGLPRHLGQAKALESIVEVRAVVYLSCSAPVVAERILHNTGGDRDQRDDDAPAAIQRKLAIFTERTAPLLDHYRSHQVRIETIEVTPRTTAEEMWWTLQSSGPCE